MKTYEVTVYDYSDMKALQNMAAQEVDETLELMYRGWFNRYVILNSDRDEYSEEEYYNYKIQCAFNRVYKLLKEIRENGTATDWSDE